MNLSPWQQAIQLGLKFNLSTLCESCLRCCCNQHGLHVTSQTLLEFIRKGKGLGPSVSVLVGTSSEAACVHASPSLSQNCSGLDPNVVVASLHEASVLQWQVYCWQNSSRCSWLSAARRRWGYRGIRRVQHCRDIREWGGGRVQRHWIISHAGEAVA